MGIDVQHFHGLCGPGATQLGMSHDVANFLAAFYFFFSFAVLWQAVLCYLVVLLPLCHTGFEHMLVVLVVTREWLLDVRAFLQVLHVFSFVAALCDLVVLPPQCHAGVEHLLELLVMARKWPCRSRAFWQHSCALTRLCQAPAWSHGF